ncbi:arginine repressor [Clostridia bacterium]|nr:arginine repressor [Clostridia bacterium]
MTTKKQRHAKILEIIESGAIERQEEIARLLREAGFNVTQATVSRDIHDLRLVKATRPNGTQTYALSSGTEDGLLDRRMHEIFSHSVLSVTPAGNIVVVKTLSAAAQAAAAVVDSMGITEIVGSIAGDDTIMIVAARPDDAIRICGILNEMR